MIELIGIRTLNGIEVVTLTADLAAKIQLPSETKGLLVLNDLTNNDKISALSLFGGASFIQKGDLLTKVNGHTLEKPRDLTEALKVSSASKTFSVHLWRKGQEIQFSIDGFGVSGLAPQKNGVVEGAKSPDLPKIQDHHASLQDQMKRQLQELFKGRMTDEHPPKQFASESDRLREEKKNSIDRALKSIPAQMA